MAQNEHVPASPALQPMPLMADLLPVAKVKRPYRITVTRVVWLDDDAAAIHFARIKQHDENAQVRVTALSYPVFESR